MANRHVLATRMLALAMLIVLTVGGVSANAAGQTKSSTGYVSYSGTRSQSRTFTAPAGAHVSLKLTWRNTAADLHLTVRGPDGTVITAARRTIRPQTASFAVPEAQTYTAVVKAMSGHSHYTLDVSVVRNHAPTAVADTTSTTQGAAVTVNPLANDSDPDGDALSLTNVGAAANGTVAKGSAGAVTYSPAAGFTGSDWFSYTVCDNRTPSACASSTVTVTVAPTVTPPPNALRWAPPALTNPVTITLPATGDQTLNLDNSRDYLIRYPAVRRVGELHLIGGRNIVIIGGASTIAPHTGIGVRNIQISDKPGVMDGRVIHIEGLDIDGSGGGEADGIGIGAPSAIVQIENVRLTGLIGHLSSTHADVIQTWGGVKQLRVYDLTGASHYNNLYLRRENSPLGPAIGPVTLDHVNLFGYVNPAGWDIPSTLRAFSVGTQPADTDCDGKGHCGPSNPDSATNCQLSSPMTLNQFYGAPPGRLAAALHVADGLRRGGGMPVRAVGRRSERLLAGAHRPHHRGDAAGTAAGRRLRAGRFGRRRVRVARVPVVPSRRAVALHGAAARFVRSGYELGGGAVSVTVTVLVTVLGGDVWVWVIVCVPPVITVVCAPPLLSPATSTPTSTPITRAATIPATASAIRGEVHPSFDGAGGGGGPGCGGGGW